MPQESWQSVVTPHGKGLPRLQLLQDGGWGAEVRSHLCTKAFKMPRKSGSVESSSWEILHGEKLFRHKFFCTLDLSKCFILILAFSILKRVQGPITVCYHTGYNICKSKMKSQFELENHGNVMKTKETGHSDVVKTFFLRFLSKSASSKTSRILWGILVFGRARGSGTAGLWWFLWLGSDTLSPHSWGKRGCKVSPPFGGPHLPPLSKALK